MSGKWCNWCNLSAKDWSLHGNRHGELWTLEIKGVTNRPLIDAIPVSIYILSILHMRQAQARNTIMYATVLHDTALAEYESCIENMVFY
ncbi:MAG: hypothetical protein ACK53Y_02440 [bacterium]